jgi:hypothetical protein
MIAKQIPYRYPNIKFMNDRLRPLWIEPNYR